MSETKVSDPGTSIPRPGRSARSEFLSRLGIYLLGIAIGLVLVGIIVQMRSVAMQAQPGDGPTNPSPTHGQAPTR